MEKSNVSSSCSGAAQNDTLSSLSLEDKTQDTVIGLLLGQLYNLRYFFYYVSPSEMAAHAEDALPDYFLEVPLLIDLLTDQSIDRLIDF